MVTLNIDDSDEFMDEIRRLSNAFGIGVIRLNAKNITESEILFPARFNENLDWDTIDRLNEENVDFKNFQKIYLIQIKQIKWAKNMTKY